LFTRLRTVNPAFFASEIEIFLGELKVDHTRRTGFLQAGHWVKCGADNGRRKVNLPPHAAQFPSQSSYSYKGIVVSLRITVQGVPIEVKGETAVAGGAAILMVDGMGLPAEGDRTKMRTAAGGVARLDGGGQGRYHLMDSGTVANSLCSLSDKTANSYNSGFTKKLCAIM
jgi:hypothetical protein